MSSVSFEKNMQILNFIEYRRVHAAKMLYR